MKLHLPSGLRKALLACLAALTLPVSLPTTLGTASGVAAVWLVSSQQLTAATVTWTYGDGTSESVECSGTEYTVVSDAAAKGLGDFQLNGLGAGDKSYGKFWTKTEAGQHDTLHITGSSSIENDTIKCDWSSFFNLGALIVDATGHDYIFDTHTGRNA